MRMEEPLWTSAELRASCGIPSPRPWYADRLEMAPAAVLPGTLYVAPEDADAADVVAALGRGAIAAITGEKLMASMADDARLLSVKDIDAALGQMARHARDRSPAIRIGIVGGMEADMRAVLAATLGLAAGGTAEAAMPDAAVALSRLGRNARYGLFDLSADPAMAALVAPQILLVGPGSAMDAEALLPVLEGRTMLVVDVTDKAGRNLARKAQDIGFKAITVSMAGKAAVKPVKIIEHSHCTCLSADIDGVAVTYKVGLSGRDWVAFSLMIMGVVKAARADLGRAALCLAGLGAVADDFEDADAFDEPMMIGRRALAE